MTRWLVCLLGLACGCAPAESPRPAKPAPALRPATPPRDAAPPDGGTDVRQAPPAVKADPPPARARVSGGTSVTVFDTDFNGTTLQRGARIAFVQIQCIAATRHCFNARFAIDSKALFSCFRVQRRAASGALLADVGGAINESGEIVGEALLARLAPAAPVPTYAVVRVTRVEEEPVFAQEPPCRGPCAHHAPRQIGTRLERFTTDMEVLPGGDSPGTSDAGTIRVPLAIGRRATVVLEYVVPSAPEPAPDRLRELLLDSRAVPGDAGLIAPWVAAETDPSLRYSGYVLLAANVLSSQGDRARADAWLDEIHRLAPSVKASLDASERASVDQTLQRLATLRSRRFAVSATTCPDAPAKP